VAVELVYETHATTVDNEAGYATGWRGADLSERGRAEAVELGERRRDDNQAAVFCLDLKQAVQTVAIAFEGLRIPVYFDARLRECDYGDWTGMPVARRDAERPRRVREPFPGGESYLDVVVRMGEFLVDLARNWEGRRVLVVGHAATRFALAHLLGGERLEDVVAAPAEWRPGWQYVLPNGWSPDPGYRAARSAA
jgi:broad specificity phosphatase PhoE